MREVLKYQSVLAAHSPEEFARCLDLAMIRRDDVTYQALLRSEAERNTWEARAKALTSAICDACQRYGGKTRRAVLAEKH